MHRHPPHGFKYMESQDLEIIPTIKSYPSGVSQQHKSFANYIDSAFWKNALLMMAPATCQLTRQTSHAPPWWPHERCFHGWWSNRLSSLHVRQSSQDDFHESRCFSYHSHASTLSGLPLFSGNSSCHNGNNMVEKGLQTSSRISNLAEDHVCPYGLVPIAPMVLKFRETKWHQFGDGLTISHADWPRNPDNHRPSNFGASISEVVCNLSSGRYQDLTQRKRSGFLRSNSLDPFFALPVVRRTSLWLAILQLYGVRIAAKWRGASWT